mmetsp:Transcript_109524/g.315418  ORF Transcript_109524/g.315418 Transcript_109524/m.315418 type:complete len:774 (+) Transcript_109524:83-2404(+)
MRCAGRAPCWLLLCLSLRFCTAAADFPSGTWFSASTSFKVPHTLCEKPASSTACGGRWRQLGAACYLLIPRSSEFKQAAIRCKEFNAEMVSIQSPEENAFVEEVCGKRMCWLGLLKRRRTSTWSWTDNSSYSYVNWEQGRQVEATSEEDNAALMNWNLPEIKKEMREGAWASGTWFDVPAALDLPQGICERRAGGRDCPGLWRRFGESCYRLLDWHSNYEKAKKRCKQLDAHVVTIHSQAEQDFVHAFCGKRMCWLGLEEQDNSEAWVWNDGRAFGFENWEVGEPNNAAGNMDENRVVMNFNMDWLKGDSDAFQHMLEAEQERFQEQERAFLKGAGAKKGVAPWADGKWYDAPRDFNLPITICKMSSFVEPASGGVDVDGWYAWRQNSYFVIDRGSDYPTAQQRCDEHLGTRLVTIDSEEENEVVRKLCGNRICWLGLEEAPDTEQWHWAGGIPLAYGSYMNWQVGQPDNCGDADETVAIMNFDMAHAMEDINGLSGGKWYDVPGDFDRPEAVCERPAGAHGGGCGDEAWKLFRESCYRRLDWKMSYYDASRRCRGLGGSVVEIDDVGEQIFVRRLCGEHMCWIGLEEHPSTLEWRWTNGDRPKFENWAAGEPNNEGALAPNRAVMNNVITRPGGSKLQRRARPPPPPPPPGAHPPVELQADGSRQSGTEPAPVMPDTTWRGESTSGRAGTATHVAAVHSLVLALGMLIALIIVGGAFITGALRVGHADDDDDDPASMSALVFNRGESGEDVRDVNFRDPGRIDCHAEDGGIE